VIAAFNSASDETAVNKKGGRSGGPRAMTVLLAAAVGVGAAITAQIWAWHFLALHPETIGGQMWTEQAAHPHAIPVVGSMLRGIEAWRAISYNGGAVMWLMLNWRRFIRPIFGPWPR
jgi:hypothetical protein